MKASDFIKLRCQIYQDFKKKWFSYSRKHNCLYARWLPTQSEEQSLIDYLGSDFKVIVSLPCSTFIISSK